jgi:hypothetical protein
MKKNPLVVLLCLIACSSGAALAQQQTHQFNDPSLPMEKRIDNLLSLMTIDEKIRLPGHEYGRAAAGRDELRQSPKAFMEWCSARARGKRQPITTTQFPQPPGMGASWDPELVREAAGVEGYEARFITQTAKYDRQILMLWGPQSDLGRDPRWGRSEEVYGEDPFLNGTMAVAFTKGLQGDDPKVLASGGAAQAFPGQRKREQPQRLVLEFRRAAVLGILLSALPHGLFGWRREGGDGLLQRVEWHGDGCESNSQEHCPRAVGRGGDFERWRGGEAAGGSAPSVSGPEGGGGGVPEGRDQPVSRRI